MRNVYLIYEGFGFSRKSLIQPSPQSEGLKTIELKVEKVYKKKTHFPKRVLEWQKCGAGSLDQLESFSLRILLTSLMSKLKPLQPKYDNLHYYRRAGNDDNLCNFPESQKGKRGEKTVLHCETNTSIVLFPFMQQIRLVFIL